MKTDYARTQSSLNLADLELVLALVRGRSLGGAAERLKVDTSTVFRSIKRIEKDVGELLFERSRSGYQPTELGRALAVHAEHIESQLQDAREAAFRHRAEPSGVLRITTTDTILHALLLPALAGFSAAYPRIDIELVSTNALANLSQRDADVAIRATRKPPEHLVGSCIGTLASAVFAAQSYLDRCPQPLRLEDADWIGLDDSLADHPSMRWRRQHYPKVQPRYLCNSVLSAAGAIVWGLGVGVAPLVLLQDKPQLRIVEGPLPELETDLWMLAHPDVRHLQRVRILFEYLRENLHLPVA